MKIGQTIIVIGNLFTELHCLTYNILFYHLKVYDDERYILFLFLFT